MKKYGNFFFSLNVLFCFFYFASFDKFYINCISGYIFNIFSLNLSKKSNLKFVLVMKILKNLSTFKFTSFCDISVVDNLLTKKNQGRFLLHYLLLSVFFNNRITVSTDWDFSMCMLTLSNLFAGANWAEREVFDMFGILFSNHDDLRRILNDYGFEGFPNQKNFPVYGFKELFYNEELSSVVYANLSLAQNYRNFFNLNSWNSK